jgi:hypothetical protein
MSPAMSSQNRKLLDIETAYTALGSPSALFDSRDIDQQIIHARSVVGDFQKAEALSMVHPSINPLQLLKTQIAVGSYEAASELLLKMQESISEGDQDKHIELVLEAARMACHQGEWAMAEKLSAQGLASLPTGITQLTLRQVRSTALIELGRLREAGMEIRLAKILSQLFPHGNLQVYVQATEVRWQTRSGDLKKAHQLLTTIWRNLSDTALNIDVCVVLCRVELEIRQLSLKRFDHLALGIWAMCERNGDKLYSALAAAEIPFSSAVLKFWDKEFELAGLYSRARLAISAKHSRVNHTPSHAVELTPEESRDLQTLILESWNIQVDLRTLKVSRVKYSDQVWKALSAIAGINLPRAEFFKQVWELQKFVPEIHDDVVRRLISRLRKTTGCQVTVVSGAVGLPSTLVVSK